MLGPRRCAGKDRFPSPPGVRMKGTTRLFPGFLVARTLSNSRRAVGGGFVALGTGEAKRLSQAALGQSDLGLPRLL